MEVVSPVGGGTAGTQGVLEAVVEPLHYAPLWVVVAQWGLWWLSGRVPGYKSCSPRFKSRAIPTVPKNVLGTVKWQVKIVQRQHMS